MKRKLAKTYGKKLSEIDVCSKVSVVQLFDRSIWINLQNGFFQEKVTGDQQNVKYIYHQIWRGMIPNTKGGNRVICSRRWSPRSKSSPLKEIKWGYRE